MIIDIQHWELPRHNFSLVACNSLKFTHCSLLVVKLLVARCKICLFLVADVAHYKKSLVTRCKIRSLLVADVAHYKKSLVARCKNALVTRCEIPSLLVAEVARSKKSLVSRCEIPSILIANNHSSLKQSPAGIIVCLKSTKLDESFSFFNVNYFLGKIYKWVKSQQLLALSQRNE